MSEQDRIFSNNINTISNRQVMRIKKNIIQGIICWSNTSLQTNIIRILYGRPWAGEIIMCPFNKVFILILQQLVVNGSDYPLSLQHRLLSQDKSENSSQEIFRHL